MLSYDTVVEVCRRKSCLQKTTKFQGCHLYLNYILRQESCREKQKWNKYSSSIPLLISTIPLLFSTIPLLFSTITLLFSTILYYSLLFHYYSPTIPLLISTIPLLISTIPLLTVVL